MTNRTPNGQPLCTSRSALKSPAVKAMPVETTSTVQHKHSRFFLFAALGLGIGLFTTVSKAEDRMQVEGKTIIFNTDDVTDADDKTPGIIYADVNLFGDLVMNHTDVDTVIVSGGGGSTSAAYDIANKISEYGMSTIARNNCSSACAIIFLAGSERTLEKGARLGFHRSTTTAEDHEEYYRKNKDKLGWANEFAYADHSYQDGQISARNFVEFTARRGVSLDFILRALSYSPRDMWYPTTEELLEAGVLLPKKD